MYLLSSSFFCHTVVAPRLLIEWKWRHVELEYVSAERERVCVRVSLHVYGVVMVGVRRKSPLGGIENSLVYLSVPHTSHFTSNPEHPCTITRAARFLLYFSRCCSSTNVVSS